MSATQPRARDRAEGIDAGRWIEIQRSTLREKLITQAEAVRDRGRRCTIGRLQSDGLFGPSERPADLDRWIAIKRSACVGLKGGAAELVGFGQVDFGFESGSGLSPMNSDVRFWGKKAEVT